MKAKTARRFLRRNSAKLTALQSPSWQRRMTICERVVKEAEVNKCQ